MSASRDHRPALGLESKTVRLVPYDSRWPGMYAEEAGRIGRVLAERGLTLQLEHTGSTAIPGLAAKPILDILAGRDADTDRAALIAALESAGYIYRGESGIPGRDFFRRGDPRSYHVHLTERGSQFWRDHLIFRERLRRDPAAARAYAEVKAELARRFPMDRERYIEGKTDFVLGILRESGSHT